MKKFIAWSRVLGEGLSDEWNPDCETYEAKDGKEALHKFLDDVYVNLLSVKAALIDGSNVDGKAAYKYEYEGKMITLEIEMREVKD